MFETGSYVICFDQRFKIIERDTFIVFEISFYPDLRVSEMMKMRNIERSLYFTKVTEIHRILQEKKRQETNQNPVLARVIEKSDFTLLLQLSNMIILSVT